MSETYTIEIRYTTNNKVYERFGPFDTKKQALADLASRAASYSGHKKVLVTTQSEELAEPTWQQVPLEDVVQMHMDCDMYTADGGNKFTWLTQEMQQGRMKFEDKQWWVLK